MHIPGCVLMQHSLQYSYIRPTGHWPGASGFAASVGALVLPFESFLAYLIRACTVPSACRKSHGWNLAKSYLPLNNSHPTSMSTCTCSHICADHFGGAFISNKAATW